MRGPMLSALCRIRRHKWFSAEHPDTEDGWHGPFSSVEAAAYETMKNGDRGDGIVYLASGYKTTKEERAEGFDDWQIDSKKAFKIEVPMEDK